MIRMFGIKNCDTVKKAQKWLLQNQISFEFIDFRTNPVKPEQLQFWLYEIGKDKVINKRSTTFRKLNDEQKIQLEGNNTVALLLEHPTLIKRPVLEHDKGCLVGFNQAKYESIFAAGNGE